MEAASSRSIVLSGIRATGTLHLGNYLGAVKQCVEMAEDPKNDCLFFVADLHTITTRPDPIALKRDRRLVVLDFLAAGLDPERSTIYTQSSVPETTELAWILSCLTPVAELMRMHHFKEKKDQLEAHGIHANAGLLTYPILMAADILGPLANVVPVGDDQRAHVEMARELARRFNLQYGELFPEPQEKIRSDKRVPSLSAGGKMGKSDESGVIGLDEKPDVLWEKLRVAPTDPARERRSDPGSPDKCNIFTLHEFVSTGEELRWAFEGCTTAGIGCIDCKKVVHKNIDAIIAPIRERRAEILAKSESYVDDILHEGGKRARARIKETVERAKDLAGIPSAVRATSGGV